MNKEELIAQMAQMDWKPTSGGGIAIEKATFEAYRDGLRPSEKIIAQALTFGHGSSSVGGYGYFAGIRRGTTQVGSLGDKTGAAGYAYTSEEFAMAPNELTAAIRSTNRKFQKAYSWRIGDKPQDLSMEDAVGLIVGASGWKMEQRGEEVVAVGGTEEVERSIMRQARARNGSEKVIRFMNKNAERTGEHTIVHGRLAGEIGKKLGYTPPKVEEPVKLDPAEAARLEAVNAAYDRDPPAHMSDVVAVMREGMDLAGHRGDEAKQMAEEIQRRRRQADEWRLD